MNSFEVGRLSYLLLLGAMLVFWLFVRDRKRLGAKLQALMAWALIFIGVIAAVGLWDDIRSTVIPQQSVISDTNTIILPRAPDGHYYVTLDINDTAIRFVVDTGASDIVLTRNDAQRAGIDLDGLAFLSQANTANGVVRTAPTRLKTVTLGPVMDQNVTALVNSGDMRTSLLGMRYLQRFERLEIQSDRMVLQR